MSVHTCIQDPCKVSKESMTKTQLCVVLNLECGIVSEVCAFVSFCFCHLRGVLQRLGVASLDDWSTGLLHTCSSVNHQCLLKNSGLHSTRIRVFPLKAVLFMAIQFVILFVPPPKPQPPSAMSAILLSNLNKLLLTFRLSWCSLLGPTYK